MNNLGQPGTPSISTISAPPMEIMIFPAENGWVIIAQNKYRVAKTWNEAVEVMALLFEIEGDNRKNQADG